MLRMRFVQHALGFLIADLAGMVFAITVGLPKAPFPSPYYFGEAVGAGLPIAVGAALVYGILRLLSGPVQPLVTWIIAACVSLTVFGILVLKGMAI